MLHPGLLVAGAVGLFLLGLLVGRWAPFGEWGGTSEAEPDVEEIFRPSASPEAVCRQLADQHPELQRLYEQVGFSPVLAQKGDRLLRALRDAISVEIPDMDAFRAALADAREEMQLLPDQPTFEDETTREDVERARALLDDVWAVRDDPEAVRERLAQAPIDEQLPYVERVPVTRQGTVHWRMPARVSVLRKRPDDTQQFRRRLDRLNALVENASLPRPDAVEENLRAALTRLRRDVDAEDAYVPALLIRLEEAVSAWLQEAPRAEWTEKRTQLDQCLLDVRRLDRARQTLDEDASLDASTREALLEQYQERVRRRTRAYVEADWMHTDWLTDRLLTHLLTSELRDATGAATDQLAAIVDEVRTRSYDPQESRRRLRDYESTEGFVQSQAFTLLRIREGEPLQTT